MIDHYQQSGQQQTQSMSLILTSTQVPFSSSSFLRYYCVVTVTIEERFEANPGDIFRSRTRRTQKSTPTTRAINQPQKQPDKLDQERVRRRSSSRITHEGVVMNHRKTGPSAACRNSPFLSLVLSCSPLTVNLYMCSPPRLCLS